MRDRLVGGTVALVRVLRVGNVAFAVLMAAAALGSVPFAGVVEAHLAIKYARIADPALVLNFMRLILVAGCGSAYPVGRLLRALSEMLATVREGDPFVATNAARLRVIGWALLTLQLLDLVFGVAVWWAKAHRIEVQDWQPSVTGWLAVLVAFVLARVFTAGAAMREDIEGTV